MSPLAPAWAQAAPHLHPHQGFSPRGRPLRAARHPSRLVQTLWGVMSVRQPLTTRPGEEPMGRCCSRRQYPGAAGGWIPVLTAVATPYLGISSSSAPAP